MTGIALTVEGSEGAEATPPSRLVFSGAPLCIGRARSAELCLPDSRVSSRHAEIRREGRDWTVVDLASTNGTWLNDKRLSPDVPRLLRTGDVVELASFRLRVEVDVVADGGTATTTALVGGQLVRQVLRRFHPEAEAPRLAVVAGLDVGASATLAAPGASVRIGRAEHCELCLSDATASREHARVRRDLGGLVLEDAGSLNATRLNNEPVRGERRLADRDEIKIGATRITVSDPALALVEAMEPLPDEAIAPPGSAVLRRARAVVEEAQFHAHALLDGQTPLEAAASEPPLVEADPPSRLDGRAAQSRPTSPPVARAERSWLIVAALASGLVALGAGWLLWTILAG